GEALVEQLRVPGVVVAVRPEARLHVDLGRRCDPPADHLEQAHLEPRVVAEATCSGLGVEDARDLPPVPRRDGWTVRGGVAHACILTACSRSGPPRTASSCGAPGPRRTSTTAAR